MSFKFFLNSPKINLILFILFFCTFKILASDLTENDIAPLKKLERFLQKNKKEMTMVKRGKYTVDNDQFNEIFPPCSFAGQNVESAVGRIENEYHDIERGEDIISTGTGTIIENNFNLIKVLTAKHVVFNRGLINFTLASAMVMEGSEQVSYLAKYKANKVFVHPIKDIAYVEFELIENALRKDKLEKIYKIRDHSLIDRKRKFTIYHYPYGVETQRRNEGFIVEGNDKHTSPTLGGSSGAPLIREEKIIGIHVGGDIPFRGETDFQGKIEEIEKHDGPEQFTKHNNFLRLSDIDENFNDFIERS